MLIKNNSKQTQHLYPSLLCIFVAWFCFLPGASASDQFITIYGGLYTDDSLQDIFSGEDIKTEDSYIAALAIGKVFAQTQSAYRWEVEGQVVKHFREQTHWEFNIAFLLRWQQFPWNNFMRTSLAIGDGLSYATEVPPLELASHTNEGATRLLNYFVMELTFAPPTVKHWSLITRIHHRSGMAGLFDDVKGGSNVLSLGVKYDF